MKWISALLAGCFLALTISAPAQAADNEKKEGLRDLLAELAASARRVAEKNKQTGVRVGYFTPSGIDNGNAGGAFMAELAFALGTFASPTSPLELKGEFFFLPDPTNRELRVIKVKARLTDTSSGEDVAELKEFVGFIRSATDIARITGATVSFKPDDEYKGPPSEGRIKDLQRSLPPAPGKAPEVQAHIDGTRISTRKDSPYAVEIRTKTLKATGAATPRKAVLENGLVFVPIERGEVYEVRVINNANHEIAVSLNIDGIDQFTFSEDRVAVLEPVLDAKGNPELDDKGKPRLREVLDANGKPLLRPRFTHWVVAPCKGDKPGEVLIQGWHKTANPERKDNVLSFLVTEYGKGAASKFPTQSQGKVGTITVGISLTHSPGSRSGSETGFGPPVEVKQTVVKRDISAPHEFITVRYAR